MNSRSSIASTDTGFSLREHETLRALRAKYETGQHLFTQQELARLRFVRWLIQSPGWNRAMDEMGASDSSHHHRARARKKVLWHTWSGIPPSDTDHHLGDES